MIKRVCGVLVFAVFTIGCAGQQVDTSGLETALAKCESERTALTEANAELKARAERADQLAAERKANLDALRAALQDLIDAGELTVTVRNGLIVLQLPNKILFASGQAAVKPEAKATLEKVAGALAKIERRRFFVSGHTDNAAIAKSKFKSNWELSTVRALNVHGILLAAGVSAENLAVAGFADTDAIEGNDTKEGMAMNRRTKIIVMPDLTAVLPAVAKK